MNNVPEHVNKSPPHLAPLVTSAGPCKKRPGWSTDVYKTAPTGRSHRSKIGKAKVRDWVGWSAPAPDPPKPTPPPPPPTATATITISAATTTTTTTTTTTIQLVEAIEETRRILNIPADYRIAVVPASDTGAIEMAMWSMLGERPVVSWRCQHDRITHTSPPFRSSSSPPPPSTSQVLPTPITRHPPPAT